MVRSTNDEPVIVVFDSLEYENWKPTEDCRARFAAHASLPRAFLGHKGDGFGPKYVFSVTQSLKVRVLGDTQSTGSVPEKK